MLQGIDILQFLSGSILGSLSKGQTENKAIAQTIMQGYQDLELEALIVVGGDGSLDIIYDLAQEGQWNIIAIPKTIDNDIPFTDRAIGFDTAVDQVTSALYDLTFTAASHDRTMVVQVMGRNAGHLALRSGIAGGADIILIPELTPQIDADLVKRICLRISQLRCSGRKFALIVIAEGVKNIQGEKEKYIGDYLAQQIDEVGHKLCLTDKPELSNLDSIETRATVLGHIQRSGTPSSYDRLLAATFAKKAVDLIEEENYNQLVVWHQGQVQIQPLDKVVAQLKKSHQLGLCPSPVQADDFLVQTARSLGIYLG